MSNVCKFTEQGRVRIEAIYDRSENRGWVRFIVSDTGVGIAPEQLNKIVEEFSQAQDTSGKFGGAGLDLTISRRLCELIGGDITVESTPGTGSTFTIHLPASSVSASEV